MKDAEGFFFNNTYSMEQWYDVDVKKLVQIGIKRSTVPVYTSLCLVRGTF